MARAMRAASATSAWAFFSSAFGPSAFGSCPRLVAVRASNPPRTSAAPRAKAGLGFFDGGADGFMIAALVQCMKNNTERLAQEEI